VTDYLVRVVQRGSRACRGADREIPRRPEFRAGAWLDPDRLAAYGSRHDVRQRSRQQSDSGIATPAQMVQVNLSTTTQPAFVEEFRTWWSAGERRGGAAGATSRPLSLGADDYDSRVSFDGQRAVYIGIQIAPAANLLDVIAACAASSPTSRRTAAGPHGAIVYDSTAS